MFEGSLTDQMHLQDAIRDLRSTGLYVGLDSSPIEVLIWVREPNGWVLTYRSFRKHNILGAIEFITKTTQDYRSWK